MKRYFVWVILGLVLLLTGLPAVTAQTATAADRGHAAPVDALPMELQGLDVKDYFIDAMITPAGVMQTVIGHVVVLHADSREAFFAADGDAVFKHDVIFTLRDSRCRVKFSTDDVITMGENARIDIEEHIDDRQQQKKTSVFNMLRGKVMFYAVRLFKYRTASMSVKTPTAVVGVRGTKFGVEVRMMGADVAQSAPLYLADTSGSDFRYLLAAVPPGVVTDAHSFVGAIDVTALADNTTEAVIDGQTRTVTSEAGLPTHVTPPEVAANFNAATLVPEPGAVGQPVEPKEEIIEDLVEAGEQAKLPVEVVENTVETETNADNQASNTTTETAAPAPLPPPAFVGGEGYFTGMLNDRECCGPSNLDNVYVSRSRKNTASGSVAAEGLFDPTGAFIEGATSTGSGLVYLQEVTVDSYTPSSGPLGSGWPVTLAEMGYNEYMGWGYWYVQNDFIINTFVHDLHHKGYYVFGYPTPDPAVSGISGWYVGPAYGTFWAPNTANPALAPQGIDMQGGFECFVNGSSQYIYDFNLAVISADQQYAAAIETPTGKISGILSGSSFRINDPGEYMTWTMVMPGTPSPTVITVFSYRAANGSLYGPNGEKIGGAWGMKEITGFYPNERYVGAQGIFIGDNYGASPP